MTWNLRSPTNVCYVFTCCAVGPFSSWQMCTTNGRD